MTRVPANADFVIEGYVDQKNRSRRRPFGDHTGYYSLPEHILYFISPRLLIGRIPSIQRRLLYSPPMEDFYIGHGLSKTLFAHIQNELRGNVDLALRGGVFHNLVFVSVKKTYPMQAYKINARPLGWGNDVHEVHHRRGRRCVMFIHQRSPFSALRQH